MTDPPDPPLPPAGGGELPELEARLAGVESAVEEILALLEDVLPAASAGGAGRPPTVYPDAAGWVAGHFAALYSRPLGGEHRWCQHWQAHPEAVDRLDALWRAWEVLRRDPGTGLATWYRDYLDPQLPVLLGGRGPFSRCTVDRHEAPRRLPLPDDAAPMPTL